MAAEIETASWNIWVHHDPTHVRAVIRDVRDDYNPIVFGLMECAHMFGKLEGLGYQVFHVRRRASRKGVAAEAANSAILVRNGTKVKRAWLVRMRLMWRGPKLGKLHDPREFPVVNVVHDRETWKVGNACHLPFGQKQTAEADKHLRRLLRRTVPGRPVLIGGDLQAYRRTISRRIASKVGAWIRGFGIDLLMGRNCTHVRVKNLGKRGSDAHPIVLVRVRSNRR